MGRQLCQMRHEERLAFIAEGLPILLSSSQGFQKAAQRLHRDEPDSVREEDVLVSFADEEAAKILILLDIVRTPPAQVNELIGKMMGWFYNHLARLVYAKATTWRPTSVAQLQNYVIRECEEHTLEGFAGEYILPGGPVYERESALYADIQAHEDGELTWHRPRSRPRLFGPEESEALLLANSMQRLGLLSLEGLRVIASVWNGTRFSEEQTIQTSDELIQETVAQLVAAGLAEDGAEEANIGMLCDLWQLPMYDLQICPNARTIEELREIQERMLNDAVGGW